MALSPFRASAIPLFRYRGHMQSISLARSGIPRHRWRRLGPQAGPSVAPPLLPACGKASPWYNPIVMAIRAHFDGKVIVPDEPVDIPVGKPLEIEFRLKSGGLPPPGDDRLPPEEIKRRLAALKVLREMAVSGPLVADESLRRENLYEPDRGL